MSNNGVRVLQVNLQPGWGGGEQFTYTLGGGLRSRGYEVSFLCPPGSPLQGRLAAAQLPVAELPIDSPVDPGAFAGLVKELQRFRPHVMHTHTSRELLLAIAAGRLTRIPAIVATRHVALPVTRGTRWICNWGCDRILFVSRAARDAAVASGIDPRRTRLLYGAIDVAGFAAGVLPREEARRRLGIGTAGCVGMAGNLIGGKGADDLLRAARRLVDNGFDATFVLAGDGEARAGLEALTAELGLPDRVRFLGFRSDVVAVMSALDVLVVPSTMPEAFPLAILEGMAAGRPVVATRVPGGIPEVVEDGVTGLLVPPHDPGALASAVARLLQQPELAQRLANAGRTRVATRHDLPEMLDETERVYRELLSESGSSRAAARGTQRPCESSRPEADES